MPLGEVPSASAEYRPAGLLCPFDLDVSTIGCLLNAELADDPVYDGFEVQGYDDDVHGRGLLVFLSRRETRMVDYYVTPGLEVDRDRFVLGAGTGGWYEAHFEAARLVVDEQGVDLDVAFSDVDGRRIELQVNDRDGSARRRGTLLAPVGSGIDEPASLLLVWLHGFDLVHDTGAEPIIRIDGRQASTGSLPGSRLHNRHLIKMAAPLTTVAVNLSIDGPAPIVLGVVGRTGAGEPSAVDRADAAGDGTVTPPGPRFHLDETGAVAEVVATTNAGGRARLALRPGVPDLRAIHDGEQLQGRWRVDIDGTPGVTGGSWQVRRDGEQVVCDLEVTRRWKPGRQPPLMMAVTTLVPVFSRWPTTYRWLAVVTLGDQPTIRSGWQRTAAARGGGYRRLTSS